MLSHTPYHGIGCFEGVCVYLSEAGITSVFHLPEHTKRLVQSVRILEMNQLCSEDVTNWAIVDVSRGNKLTKCYIRPIIFYGAEGIGLHANNLNAHMIVAAWGWNSYLSETAMEKGVCMRIGSSAHHHVNATFFHAKANVDHLNPILAFDDVLRDGYDEALIASTQRYVAEGNVKNIYLVKDDVIATPNLNFCLDGITCTPSWNRSKNIAIPCASGTLPVTKSIFHEF